MVCAAVGDGVGSVAMYEKPLPQAVQPLQVRGGIGVGVAYARAGPVGGGAGETMGSPMAGVEAVPMGQPAFFEAQVQA